MKGFKSFFKEAVSAILIAGLIVAAIKIFIIDNRVIPSASMYPTIYVGDMVLVNKAAYYFNAPVREDIVVFKPLREIGQKDLIKRVIGLPGETVEIKDNQVFVDGSPLKESYLNEEPQYVFGPVTVPEGCIFVLGDNRNQSFDSHQWPTPFLEIKSVKGKAFFRYWPLERMGKLNSEEEIHENSLDQ